MNPFSADQILGGPFAWTWQTSLRASILILLVLLVCRVLGRRLPPVWHYGLWFLVVVRLLLPVAPPASFSLLNAVPSGDSVVVEPTPPAAFVLPGVSAVARSAPQTAALWLEKPSGSSPWQAGRSWSWRAVCVLVWPCGVVACLGHAWHRHRRWRRRLRGAQEIQNPVVLTLLRRCEGEVGCSRPVRLAQTSRLSSPAVFGWGRPCLMLPRSFLENFQEEELRLVLLHELIHIRRRDVAANWLLIFLQAWHWFNPLVWVACRQFRAARELYCDALVLRRLDARDRRVYGQTLVKLAEQLSSARLSPGLVPVLHRKSELKRRILMMTQHPKAPRLFAFAAATLMAVLVGLTFTGAAEKGDAAADGQNKEPPPPSADKQKAAERVIQVLEKELDRIDAQVRRRQEELDAVKSQLKITASEEMNSYHPDTDTETFRYMERAVIDAKSQYQKLTALYEGLEQLNSKSRTELRKALPTASPDNALSTLMQNHALYQQQLVLKQTQYDSAHPEVQALQKVLETIDQQVEERIDGIMLGLRTRIRAEEAAVQQLDAQLAKTREMDLQRTIELRPLLLAKRDLENLLLIRERLQLRLMQEEVDAALPKSTNKD
jgi:beta-lactamase regulating signal transducer with metallopeptidase domain